MAQWSMSHGVARYRGWLRLVALVVVLGVAGTGAMLGAAHGSHARMEFPLVVATSRDALPAHVHQAGQRAEAAYAAALASPEVLASVPCLCGCIEALAHTSNLDCYIRAIDPGGTVYWDTHGIYCLVCQQITEDALAGAAQGLDGPALRELILRKYGG